MVCSHQCIVVTGELEGKNINRTCELATQASKTDALVQVRRKLPPQSKNEVLCDKEVIRVVFTALSRGCAAVSLLVNLPLGLFVLVFVSSVSLSSCICWWLPGLGNSVGMEMSPEVHERGSKKINEATSRHNNQKEKIVIMVVMTFSAENSPNILKI